MNVLLLACAAAICTQTPAPKTQVMILGVYHFANPGLDLVKAPLDDHMSPKRQREIQDVLDRLAKFKPTKIMIERTPEDGFNDRYHGYLNGTHTLAVNEVDQIGMRLAKTLGHKDMYAIDWHKGMDFDSVMAFAQKHDPQFMEFFSSKIGEVTKMMSDLPNHTVRENFMFMNDPNNLKLGLEPYIRMLELNDGKEFPGASLVSGWYTRNIYIYSLMAKEVKPDDRVLLIFGSGHAPILRHLVEMSGNMELVEPNAYLKG